MKTGFLKLLIMGLIIPFLLAFVTVIEAHITDSEEYDMELVGKSQSTLEVAEKFFNNITFILQALDNQTTGVDERLKKLESSPYLKPGTPEDQLRFSQVFITKGSSYKSETLEEVPRDIQARTALAIEIKNYLDVPLKNFRSYITKGAESRPHPKKIDNRTAEVFSLTGGRYHPEGAFSYEIDVLQESLHVYFLSTTSNRRLAIAFLDNSETVSKIYQAKSGNPITADPSAFAATAGAISDKQAIKLDIHKDDLYARAISRVISTDKHVLSIELYSFP